MAEQNNKVAVVERKPASVFDQLEHEMTDMRRRMQSVFRWPFAPFASAPAALDTAWAPTTDAYEADGKFVVKAELPGVKQEDITVRVEDGFLTIAAKRQEETERKEAQYHTCERFLGTMQRSFALPEGMEPDKITARFADGMLEVQVPLPAQPPPKARGTEIPVTA
jgi:HSP20 family protein